MKIKWRILAALLAVLTIHVPAAGKGRDTIPTVYDSVMTNIRQIQWAGVKDTAALRLTVAGLLNTIQTDGSWTDINYADRAQTNWTPVAHLDRLRSMALAYTRAGGYYYGNAQLQQRIAAGLAYWYSAHPTSTNWYMQQIASPQRVGVILILMRTGLLPLPDTTVQQLLGRMATEGGRPDQSGSQGTGANKLDIATHWIYRGCLAGDAAVLSFGVAQAYYPLFMTTGEGIQYDMSYLQHGMQLYIGGYGSVLLNGEVSVALFTVGTSYALAGSRLALLSSFMRNTFLPVIRGQYFHFDVLGRGVSRNNALLQSGMAGTAASMKLLDPAYAPVYDSAISRLTGVQPAEFGVQAGHSHFWKSDYALHVRPAYSFDVRTVSARTLRNENGNGENLKGYFLADGATNIATTGNEYYNIFPVWDWNRIPGVTAPLLNTIPVPAQWGTAGTSTFTGGVSDSLYGVTTYAYTDNNYSINTTAKKSWFFFNDEIVCLGAGITATAAGEVNTTVNQCLLDGPVTVSAGGATTVLNKGSRSYPGNLRWALHHGIGYLFPQGGAVHLANEQQAGTWKAINNTSAADTVRMDVFKLWLNHGGQPVNNSYAYMILPGKQSAADMEAYDTTNIRILANTDSVQVVRHQGLGIWQLVFFRAATYTGAGVTIRANAGCALILKNIGTPQVTVHLADPSQLKSSIALRLQLPGITGEKHLVMNLPTTPYAGATVRGVVNAQTPDYTEPAPENIQRIYAVADAYVNDGANAAVNYGTASTLIIKKDNTGYNREVYTKFPLPAMDTSRIARVTFQLQVKNANISVTNTNWQVNAVADNSWTELGINWNNKPASTVLPGLFPGSPVGTAVEFDITARVKDVISGSQPLLSLHTVATARGDGKTDAGFYSRETADSALQPQLKIYLKPLSSLAGKTFMENTDKKRTGGTVITVTPNPATDVVYISGGATGPAVLTDGRGQVLKRIQLTAGARTTLDVSGLPPGIYYFKSLSSTVAQKLLIVR
ncbi:polysaccharide lyase family 8 super-sandwich domain-containing protein [Chitinophaga nivalis]|uniref:DNRLRE domain-containing protein n=1 Tax=Chitinophaga nivalis TaxID=2991709 RepID=A0ABT3IKH4_9BACT|nr:polysaccharide lyase family 8 super-sandwich domain-containing protein [Chitinophaga nivalis]MCW3465839.1 DNRLRE domain-containing protein [Chitinophaga nivalis]MCW3484470.1 DNRLRE domain-containing protein [Chitinophaga nivalis]